MDEEEFFSDDGWDELEEGVLEDPYDRADYEYKKQRDDDKVRELEGKNR